MAKYSKCEGVEFIRDIFGENRFDGYVIIYRSTSSKDFKKIKRIKANEFPCYLENMSINMKYNYYFTLNTFKNGKGKRLPTNSKDSLFGINGIVVDIDCHKNSVSEKDIYDEIDYIMRESKSKGICLPHYIISSGRGIHLYYLLEPCSYKICFLVDMASAMLKNFYDVIIEEPFELDLSVVNDRTKSIRLPYTINVANGKMAKIVKKNIQPKLNINDFLEMFVGKPYEEIEEATSTKKVIAQKNIGVPKGKKPPNVARCKKVIEGIELYQNDKIQESICHQNRNRTCLIYSSFLLHLYTCEDAFNKLSIFNSNYTHPLSSKRLKYILDYCYKSHISENKSQYLYFTNKTILEYLDISDGNKYNIIYTPDFNYNEMLASKARERENKRFEKVQNRNRVIEDLLFTNYTYDQISKDVGVSISTISRIAKDENIVREKKSDIEPWKELGVSRATYYRRLKK